MWEEDERERGGRGEGRNEREVSISDYYASVSFWIQPAICFRGRGVRGGKSTLRRGSFLSIRDRTVEF